MKRVSLMYAAVALVSVSILAGFWFLSQSGGPTRTPTQRAGAALVRYVDKTYESSRLKTRLVRCIRDGAKSSRYACIIEVDGPLLGGQAVCVGISFRYGLDEKVVVRLSTRVPRKFCA